MLNNVMHKDIIDFLENNIIGQYDNDTLKLIINYIKYRIDKIEEELESEEV